MESMVMEDLHARSDQHAVLDRLAHPGVGPARIPHRGDAERERLPERLRHPVERVGERPVHDRQLVQVLVLDGQMDVAVEQPRKQRAPTHIDAFVSVQARADLHDPTVLEGHVGLRNRRSRPVEDHPIRQDRPHAPSSCGPFIRKYARPSRLARRLEGLRLQRDRAIRSPAGSAA
jgi:hypothetical protein